MSSQRYWRQRFLDIALEQQSRDDKNIREISRLYRRAKRNIQHDLDEFYRRYARNDEISLADAQRLLSKEEQRYWRMTLEEFREKAIEGGYDQELNREYYRSRVSRLQRLQTQINMELIALARTEERLLTKHLKNSLSETYYRNIYEVQTVKGFSSNFARMHTQNINEIVSRSFHEKHFSERVWTNRKKLVKELRNTLSDGIIRGDGIDRMSKDLAKRMNVGRDRAITLVQTESANISGIASAESYKETSVDKYRFLATLEIHTCDKCQKIHDKSHKKPFTVSEMLVSVNYPPIHPNCRCTTVPEIEGLQLKQWMRNPETGKGEIVDAMPYKDWKQKYVNVA